ncbi:hypothetical protein H4R18_003072 [Coemansia javaensis]|uniref:Phosphoribulokinase/uridine kinase domain-containing protein n=1 Tax=Coemansia javaensis TaxID=2761396 RepID=A0A9W8HEV7_9FUNG|nr:hypothetical protein H4R18_003072 [Coemansia javaensis]
MSSDKNTQETVDELSRVLVEALGQAGGQRRVVVAVAGTAGSGKTHLCGLVRSAVNASSSSSSSSSEGEVCAVLPMDGFHLSKAQLAALDDPDAAMRRRGAHWTFDARGFVDAVRRVRDCASDTVRVPSFDHTVGDPVPAAIEIRPSHRVVLVEGLYAHASEQPWAEMAQLADELWWISPCSAAQCRARLAQRHVAAGLAADMAAAELRIATNDDLNSKFILAHRLAPTRTIAN